MSHEEWVTVNLPKVDGTWNLHNALADQPLDFFFMSSSTMTVTNQPGQGNYNAANTFLEAFCQYRHSLGLPASVLNICPIDDVGFVAENPAARKSLKANGHYFLQEREFIDYLGLSLLNSRPPPGKKIKDSSCHPSTVPSPWANTAQIVMGLRSDLHPDDPNNRTNWRRDRRMGIYHNIRNSDTVNRSASDNSQLKQFLLRCAEDPDLLAEKTSADLLAHEIKLKAFSLVLKDPAENILDTDITLGAIGVDSLMAIELRRWWKQALGLELSVLEIMGLDSIAELSKVTAQRLMVKFGRKEGC